MFVLNINYLINPFMKFIFVFCVKVSILCWKYQFYVEHNSEIPLMKYPSGQ